MKKQATLVTLTAAIAVMMMTGCGQNTDTTQPPSGTEPAKETKSVGDTISEATKPVVDEAKKAVEAAKPAVEAATKEIKEAAATVVSDSTTKANALIEQAKKYISETKYSDAINVINQLTGLTLTPEQENTVADLKSQIRKAMASLSSTNAAGAIGNLLK
jgi:cell division septum initiation protein DivIVA